MKNPFQIIEPWITLVLEAIKKDIRMDHLPVNPIFAKVHFGNRPLNRLTTDEILIAYAKALLSGEDPDLAEWVINHWVFKHGEIYAHFAEHLDAISNNYQEIDRLTEDQSHAIVSGSMEKFGALNTYLFSVLNAVVFPDSVFASLRLAAQKEESAKQAEQQEVQGVVTLEKMAERHAKELRRLQEKYEGKIAGVLKKYTVEVEALKTQIRSLQKQVINK